MSKKTTFEAASRALPCDHCGHEFSKHYPRFTADDAVCPMVKYVCSDCGSDDVRLDATAVWDVGRQEWELCGVMDQGYCEGKCDGECNLEEVAI